MLVSCLLPTYNRIGRSTQHCIEEAVECFLRFDYPDRELILCNDTPGQTIIFDHPKVKVINTNERFPALSEKIHFMIGQAQGDLLMRMDDDDISLPHRISCSIEELGDGLEWRPRNSWYYPGFYKEDFNGNGHPLGIWHRDVLKLFPGGRYPIRKSGNEDQTFNGIVELHKVSKRSTLPLNKIFYIYRWGTSDCHLSGTVGGPKDNPHQAHYDAIGQRPIKTGTFNLKPSWKENYIARVAQQCRINDTRVEQGTLKDPLTVGNYFDYQLFYDWLALQMPVHCRVIEVGCMYGASICYLANKLRNLKRAPYLLGVDLGVGVNQDLFNPISRDFGDISILLNNIRMCGCQDIVSILASESTRAAQTIPDESQDAIMLDDAHDPQSVRAGLQAWYPKLKRGGFFCGHDYMECSLNVKPTVDEFFGIPQHLSLMSAQTPTCWVLRKP